MMPRQPSEEREASRAILNESAESGSIERIIPGLVEKSIESEHVERYMFAGKSVKGVVLDLGCGVGYGANFLKGAKEVIGLDLDLDALRYGKASFGSETSNLVAAEASSLPFKSSSFDSIIAFEVVEHLENPAKMIHEIVRVGRKGARVFLSTPNKLVSSPIAKRPLNPHHIMEFYRSGFVSMVASELSVRGVFGQVRCNKFVTPILNAVYNILTLTLGFRVVRRLSLSSRNPAPRGTSHEVGSYESWRITCATTVVVAEKT